MDRRATVPPLLVRLVPSPGAAGAVALSMSHRLSDEVREDLLLTYGPPWHHRCRCGQWAAKFAPKVGSTTFTSEDYEPACLRCVRARGRAAGAATLTNLWKDPQWAAAAAERGFLAAAALNASGRSGTAIRRTCTTCGFSTHAPGMGRHLKASGHAGYREGNH